MKKILFLLLAIMPLALVSCHDENDLPDVDFTVTVTGGTYVDGSIYVVQGENLVINSILVHNKENGKAAMINSAAYYWDGYYLGTAIPSGKTLAGNSVSTAGRRQRNSHLGAGLQRNDCGLGR